mgnify:CR=1 FL=1
MIVYTLGITTIYRLVRIQAWALACGFLTTKSVAMWPSMNGEC